MREIVVDWVVSAHSKFDLSQEALHLTVSILNRILEMEIVGKEGLQLLGVNAMLVASKIEDVHVPTCHEYERVTGNTYTKSQILSMESRFLTKFPRHP
ncbi:unnamed protein product [Caenorhabditis brenneri]